LFAGSSFRLTGLQQAVILPESRGFLVERVRNPSLIAVTTDRLGMAVLRSRCST
jgi:hypothetical protein